MAIKIWTDQTDRGQIQVNNTISVQVMIDGPTLSWSNTFDDGTGGGAQASTSSTTSPTPMTWTPYTFAVGAGWQAGTWTIGVKDPGGTVILMLVLLPIGYERKAQDKKAEDKKVEEKKL